MGHGSRFYFRFQAQALADGIADSVQSAPITMPIPPGLAILVAEDNPTNRLLIGKFLEMLGLTGIFAQNGEEAVQRCQTQAFDIILMDMQMPLMDGLEATGQIRQLPIAQPRIIALTANVFNEDKAQCFAAGMDDFLSKPLQFPVFEASIRRNLSARSIQNPPHA